MALFCQLKNKSFFPNRMCGGSSKDGGREHRNAGNLPMLSGEIDFKSLESA
jgi:hypothetical protein